MEETIGGSVTLIPIVVRTVDDPRDLANLISAALTENAAIISGTSPNRGGQLLYLAIE